MNNYQNILVGLDLSQESNTVIRKAKYLAQILEANLAIAHIIEPLALPYEVEIPINLIETQNLIESRAREKLNELVTNAELGSATQIVRVGQTAAELRALAKELNADLIIVGSHGRHGFALLLGSTANDVLHGSHCDVLAVRI